MPPTMTTSPWEKLVHTSLLLEVAEVAAGERTLVVVATTTTTEATTTTTLDEDAVELEVEEEREQVQEIVVSSVLSNITSQAVPNGRIGPQTSSIFLVSVQPTTSAPGVSRRGTGQGTATMRKT